MSSAHSLNRTVGFLCPSHPLDLDIELAGSVNRPAPRWFCLIKPTCVPSFLELKSSTFTSSEMPIVTFLLKVRTKISYL